MLEVLLGIAVVLASYSVEVTFMIVGDALAVGSSCCRHCGGSCRGGCSCCRWYTCGRLYRSWDEVVSSE